MMKFKHTINECDGGAPVGGDAGPSAGVGDTTAVIDGNNGCDHSENGYFGPGCFHVPVPIWGTTYRAKPTKKKRRKRKTNNTSYTSGMKIIKSYDDLVSESIDNEPYTFVLNVPPQHFEQMIALSQNENERFNIEQFTKYLDDNKLLIDENAEIVGLFGQKSKQCFACAVLSFNQLDENDCYICELMTLRPGFGMILLNNIIDHTENTWLMSDIDAGEDLCKKFYRQNGRLTEIKIDGGHWFDDGNPNRKTLHLFYADNCEDAENMSAKIKQRFMR